MMITNKKIRQFFFPSLTPKFLIRAFLIILFAERCGLKTPVEPLTGQYTPEEISSYATLCRSQFIKIDLIFYDLNVEFPEKELAKVILTARLTGTLTTGEFVDEARELQCVFMKIQKKWLFTDFEVVEVLKK